MKQAKLEDAAVDARWLAEEMLKWKEVAEELARIEARIKKAVMTLGKTQTVGDVRATYGQGRKRYDYEAVGKSAPDSVVENHTKPVVNWRAVCLEAGLEDVPFTQGEPYVSVRLLDS